jgi:hypothetical protein
MQVVRGGDWSIGYNTDGPSSDARLLLRLGEGLRRVYADVVETPVPEEWVRTVGQLECGTAMPAEAGRSSAFGPDGS